MQDLMFDFFEFYDRIANDLPDNCTVAEIGVADGVSALYLANKLHNSGKKFKLYMVDNMVYGGFLQMKTIYENIIKSGLSEFIEVIPFDSVKASKKFNGDSLDFCFLDSSHEYDETKKSLRAWYPKLKDNCILSGHDYNLYPSVKKAVDELLPKRIKRKTIKKPDHFQEFEEEDFLFIENTASNYGVFYIYKKFYFKIK